MTFEAWCRKYRPIDNGEGILFFGPITQELAKRIPLDRIWTVCSGRGGWTIKNGLRAAVVVGHIATEEPFTLDEVIFASYETRILVSPTTKESTCLAIR